MINISMINTVEHDYEVGLVCQQHNEITDERNNRKS